MNQKSTSFWSLLAILCMMACQPPSQKEPASLDPEQTLLEVNQVMDAWHHAASVADSTTYFGSMASPWSIFIGTDDSERWETSAFKTWSRRYFQRASAWTFVPVPHSRHIYTRGEVAWLDEKLDSEHMGRCRGTGVLVWDEASLTWKIDHYTLSFAVPNALADAIVEDITSHEKALD